MSMKDKKFIIIPEPVEIIMKTGYCLLKEDSHISIPIEDKQEIFSLSKRIQSILKELVKITVPIIINNNNCTNLPICFKKNDELKNEGYVLEIGKSCINIEYSMPAGAFHAISTFKQIVFQCGKDIPCLRIEDTPDFEVRGIMLDISRNKIPTMETLCKVIDYMSDLKLNQLQLYIEGFSFSYPSFPQVWRNETPITGEELVMLDRYCRERYIDLVPNQNSFGHMTPWLQRKEFKHLAECPDGCEAPWGKCENPMGLNPIDADSIEFLRKMYNDLLPNFTSEYFNVGCDETFDLGQGKSMKQCEQLGKGRVYLNFLIKIHGLLREHGKKMMIWGDIIKNHPELIPELPEDITVLEWGYSENTPTEENCRKFGESKVKFYVCPGTSTWNSITGRTECMKSNLLNTAVRGKKYGAAGFLNTDWGDCGHWQPLPASYPAFCYGAALSWGVEKNKNVDVAEYLDLFVFKDKNKKMGHFVLDVGNYYLQEKTSVFNGSGVFRTLYYSQLNDKNTDLAFLELLPLEEEEFKRVKEYIKTMISELDRTEMECEDAQIIEAEFRNSMRLILHGANLGLFKAGNFGESERIERLEELLEDITFIIKNYKTNWLKRNRTGGLEDSIKKLQMLKAQYEAEL